MALTRLVAGFCLSAMTLEATAETPGASHVDAALVAALKQAVHDVDAVPEQLDTMLWLAEMSEYLQHRIPDPFYRIRLLRIVHDEALRADLDPELVLAVIEVESSFDRHAVSPSGARGLMQIMPFWKKEIGQPNDNLFNPRTNLRYGCTILRYYIDHRQGRLADALAAYNGSLGSRIYPEKVYLSLRDRWKPRFAD